MDPETVTVKELAVKVNGFYSEFLERVLKENEEFSNLQEADCYRENCRQNDKVCSIRV